MGVRGRNPLEVPPWWELPLAAAMLPAASCAMCVGIRV